MDISSTTKWAGGFTMARNSGKTQISSEVPLLTERQMKDLIASRDLVKQLPDRKTTERQARLEKAQMLRERLRLLKQMLAFLSPKSTKSLAAEIKQIAAQLAAVGDGGGGSSSAVDGGTATSEQGGGQDASSGQDAAAAVPPATAGTAGDITTTPATPAVSGAIPTQAGKSEDRQLKDSVEEARILLRSVVQALKRKRQQDKLLHAASNNINPPKSWVSLDV